MKIYFYTLGCKVNQYESEAVAQLLLDDGHSVITSPDTADAVIVNSCTVTAESDRKTRQAVRRFKRHNPNVIILLMGCMTEAVPETEKALPEADIVIGNTDHLRVPELLREFCKTRRRIVNITPHTENEEFCPLSINRMNERTRAFMKIEDGCDRYCTYCIIPRARGTIRSRAPEDIKAEAQRLAENGFSEIVLVGINLTSYGRGEGLDICDAVRAASAPDKIKRVRLGSIEPDHMDDALLARLAAEPKLCGQFHLALQSGSDITLRRMNRHYDTAFYRDLVERIRKTFKNPSVTTDIMVGFAGESEEDFLDSVAFLKEIGFARSHVFAYSRRSGTVAAALPDQIEESEKSRRAEIMAEAAAECESRFLKTQVGLVEEVLFEEEKQGVFSGYTENYTRVSVKSAQNLSGKILPVKITLAHADYCEGELLE